MVENVDVESRSKKFQMVRESALKELKSADLAAIARLSGAVVDDASPENGSVIVEYLGKAVTVDTIAGDINVSSDDFSDCGGPLRIAEEIFILHYLLNATGKRPTGNFMPFRNMDGGISYASVFQGRAVYRFVRAFSDRVDVMAEICGSLGGARVEVSGLSVKIPVLPHIEILIQLWQGDDELPSSGNILFDDAVIDYLPTEDSVVLAENVVGRILSVDKSRV